MKMIWDNIRQFWREMIEIPADPDLTDEDDEDEVSPPCLYLTPIPSTQGCSFPPPSGININMMPFIVGETFAACKLPEYVKPYWPMIKACLEPELSHAWHDLWPFLADFPS